LTAADHEARRHSIGGSDATLIASGDVGKLQRLWAVKTGRTAPEDLSDILPVQMGTVTEELNRWWFERRTGLEISREGERITHADHPWLTATVDGIITANGQQALFEAKHVNAFNYKPAKLANRYAAQLHHSMAVTGLRHAALSIFIGTLDWDCLWIEFDPLYHAQLFQRERHFWRNVTEDRSP